MCHSINLYERVDENRLRNIVSISEEQFVFVKGKSTTDAMFALRQLQERYREGQQDLHCVFNYLGEKYDRVPREELYWCMRNKGALFQRSSLHQTGEGHVPSKRNCSSVCCRNKRTICSGSWPPPRTAFSPFLFAIMMDSLTENTRKEAPWLMMFADDVVLCAREKYVLELELEQWREALEKRGVNVSRAKTEYMCLNGMQLGSVKMQSSQLPQVT